MEPFDYLAERVEGQLRWYGTKSARAKHCHFALSFVQAVAAGSVPVLVGFQAPQAYAGLMGAIAALATATAEIGAYQRLWVSYRATAEALKREKFAFLTKSGPYADSASPVRLLVERCEPVLMSENSAWDSIVRTAPTKAAQPAGVLSAANR